MLTRDYNPKENDPIDPILLTREIEKIETEVRRLRRIVDGRGDVRYLSTNSTHAGVRRNIFTEPRTLGRFFGPKTTSNANDHWRIAAPTRSDGAYSNVVVPAACQALAAGASWGWFHVLMRCNAAATTPLINPGAPFGSTYATGNGVEFASVDEAIVDEGIHPFMTDQAVAIPTNGYISGTIEVALSDLGGGAGTGFLYRIGTTIPAPVSLCFRLLGWYE